MGRRRSRHYIFCSPDILVTLSTRFDRCQNVLPCMTYTLLPASVRSTSVAEKCQSFRRWCLFELEIIDADEFDRLKDAEANEESPNARIKPAGPVARPRTSDSRIITDPATTPSTGFRIKPRCRPPPFVSAPFPGR